MDFKGYKEGKTGRKLINDSFVFYFFFYVEMVSII